MTTDQERIALLEKRVAELEKRLPFTWAQGVPMPSTFGCHACDYGKRPCNCVLNVQVVT